MKSWFGIELKCFRCYLSDTNIEFDFDLAYMDFDLVRLVDSLLKYDKLYAKSRFRFELISFLVLIKRSTGDH